MDCEARMTTSGILGARCAESWWRNAPSTGSPVGLELPMDFFTDIIQRTHTDSPAHALVCFFKPHKNTSHLRPRRHI